MSMTLGAVTFDGYVPDSFDLPRPVKCISVVPTYGGVALFNWGNFIVGNRITLSWDMMDLDLFNTLDAMYLQSDNVAWDPEVETGTTYMVQITKFDGKLITVPSLEFREAVTMELVIMSEVTV